MAIRTVITRGYGNGTFNGTIPLVVTSGYTIGAGILPVIRTWTLRSRSVAWTLDTARDIDWSLKSRGITWTLEDDAR